MAQYSPPPPPGEDTSIIDTVRKYPVPALVAMVIAAVLAIIFVIGMIASIATYSLWMFLLCLLALVLFGGAALWIVYGFCALLFARKRKR